MELLLNLIWLTGVFVSVGTILFLPDSARLLSPYGRVRSAVLACCLLFLVFPVVSISDDLGLLRAEIEESSPSISVTKKISRPSGPEVGWEGPPLETAALGLDRPLLEQQETVAAFDCDLPQEISAEVIRCRAPPSSNPH